MMTPYRSMEAMVPYIQPKPRSRWRTLFYKFLIWKHGTFRERFKGRPLLGSCPYCPDFKLKRDYLYDQMIRLQFHYNKYVGSNHPTSILEWHKIENHKQHTMCHECGKLGVTWMGITTGPIHLKGEAGTLTCNACSNQRTMRFYDEQKQRRNLNDNLHNDTCFHVRSPRGKMASK